MTALRKNITQPADWWEAFQAAAQKESLTLSEWMGQACVDALPKKEQAKLGDRPSRGQPKADTGGSQKQ